MDIDVESISERIERLAYEKEVLRLALQDLRSMADEYPGPESTMYEIADTALNKVS